MSDALQSLLTATGLALSRLGTIDTPQRGSALFRRLGYTLDPAAFGTALTGLADAARASMSALEALAAAEDAQILPAIAQVMERVEAVVGEVRALGMELQAQSSQEIPSIDELTRRVTDLLLLDYVRVHHPELHAVLHVLGLIEHATAPAPDRASSIVHWDRFAQFVKEPSRIANDVYAWEESFDFATFATRLDQLMRVAGLPGGLYPQSESARAALHNANAELVELRLPILQRGLTPETYSQFGITLSPAEAQDGGRAGFALLPYITGASEFDFAVCDRGELSFESSTDIRGVGVVLRPPRVAEGLMNLAGAFRASIRVREKPEKAEETTLLGTAGGTRLSMRGLGIQWFAEGSNERLDLGVRAEIAELRLVLAAREGDGFLSSVLASFPVDARAEVGLAMTLGNGFEFRGGGKLSVEHAVHVAVGPFRLDLLRVALAASDEGLLLETGADIGIDLGPIHAVIENVGLRSALRFQPGNLGPADLDVSFLPPNGIGVSVEAHGVLSGGSVLARDPATATYAGAMQLSLHDSITLKAFGLIATRLPDGRVGYSLTIFLTVEDFRPIPLGLGFTLLGIGGMLGIDRTFDEGVLREGMQSGTLASLLFPRDPVGNASALIRDLARAFPARQGSYLLGLLAKIGWFTPTLVRLDLALIVELGTRKRLLALGRIRAALPSDDNDLVRLDMEAMGVVDFDAGTVAIDAVLCESRLAHKFPITGSAALRASFGNGPSFVLAVGGVNPRFTPPVDFPALDRVAVVLSSGDSPRLSCEAYFAITANTLQFGANASLYASAIGFSIQGDVGFDVLFQLAPLHFIVDYHARLRLKRGSRNLFMVSVTGELEGPRPLRVSGKATFEILWCDFTVRFDKTLVRGEPPPLPEAVDVRALLEEALTSPASWSALQRSSSAGGVALRSLPPARAGAPIVLDPWSRLIVKQQAVPLDTARDLDAYGGAPVRGERRFRLSASMNGTPLEHAALQAPFAPAQFFAMSDDEKLAAPSFEPMNAGCSFDSLSVAFDPAQAVEAPLEYQTLGLEAARLPSGGPLGELANHVLLGARPLSVERLHAATRSGAVARAKARAVGRTRFRNPIVPPAVSLNSERWMITPNGGGAAAVVEPGVRSWSEYNATLKALNREGLRWQLQPAYELDP